MTDPGERPRFMLDHMVVRLGKYLRVIGYDAEWDLGLRTHELIQQANAAGRIFVTRNSHITEQFPAVRRLILRSRHAVTPLSRTSVLPP